MQLPRARLGWRLVTRRGWVLFAMMAVLWGIPYLLIRIAVRQLDPGVVVLGRTAPAALLLAPLVVRNGQLRAVLTHWRWITLFGVVEFGAPWYLMSSAERHVTSSFTSLMICAVPLFTLVLSRRSSTHEKLPPRRLIGLFTGALGVALLVGVNVHGDLRWVAMLLVVCVGYSLGPMILQHRLSEVPGPAVVFGATGIVALLWVPYGALHWPSHVSAQTLGAIATLSLLCTAGAFLTFFELVKEVGANRSTVVVYSNTALAVLLGIALLHEPLTASIVVGFPLIMAGSYFATSADRDRRDANLAVHE
ncbi:MAG: DMT family transporter [Acidimicrobiaceae bacterium]|nr:DMT family transporter [Acidimicrobiaceae bacterium]